MSGFKGTRTILTKREIPRPKPEKVKLERVVEHVRYGKGRPVGIRRLDNGDAALIVEFGDGVERVLRLEQQYWITNIASLLPAPPKPERRAAKKKAVEVEEVGDGEEVGERGDEENDLG